MEMPDYELADSFLSSFESVLSLGRLDETEPPLSSLKTPRARNRASLVRRLGTSQVLITVLELNV